MGKKRKLPPSRPKSLVARKAQETPKKRPKARPKSAPPKKRATSKPRPKQPRPVSKRRKAPPPPKPKPKSKPLPRPTDAPQLPFASRIDPAYYSQEAYDKAEQKGRVRFVAPLAHVFDPEQTPRADIADIHAWIAARKNVIYWRERDGSWNAIATFHGSNAWDNLEKAAERLPRTAYLAIRYLLDTRYLADSPTARGRSGYVSVNISGDRKVRKLDLTPMVTRTHRDVNWQRAQGEVFAFPGTDPDEVETNGGIYQRMAGLAVHWPRASKKPAKERKRNPPKRRNAPKTFSGKLPPFKEGK